MNGVSDPQGAVQAESADGIRVFISYSHDSDTHRQRVRKLSGRLRADGIDCRIDQYEAAPEEGWRRWMERCIAWADFVLVVCTETYHRRARGDEVHGGRGAIYEASLLLDQLYEAGMRNRRVIPILLPGASPQDIPAALRSYTYYVLDDEALDAPLAERTGYTALYRHLTDQPALRPPPLGTVRPLGEETESPGSDPSTPDPSTPGTSDDVEEATPSERRAASERRTTPLWRRGHILRLLGVALPLTLGYGLLVSRLPMTLRPTWLPAVLLGIVVIGGVFFWRAVRASSPTLGPGFMAFFVAFVLCFTVLADTEWLAGERHALAGFEDQLPSNVLRLGWLEDWHYRLATPPPAAGHLLVVTFPSVVGQNRERLRSQLRWLLNQARQQGARGVALDMFLEQQSAYDALLAQEVQAAEDAGMPVIFGLRQQEDGLLVRQRLAPLLEEVVADNRRGHLQAYEETDGKVRLLPMVLPGVGEWPALSVAAAQLLRGSDRTLLMDRRLVRFLPPADKVAVLRFSPELDVKRLRDRFLFVGSGGPEDHVVTAFGQHQGVEIHAWSAHALATGSVLVDLDPKLTLPLIYIFCFVLLVSYADDPGLGRLLGRTVALSAMWGLVAVVALRWGRLWIELSHGLLALWLLTALLLLYGLLLRRRGDGSAAAA